MIFKLKILAVRLLEPWTSLRRRTLAPRMLWGYRNRDGKFHSLTRISSSAYLYNSRNIDISNNVFVWHYTIIDGTDNVHIGEGCHIGAWVGILTHSSHQSIRLLGQNYIAFHEDQKVGYLKAPVTIGNYVWIGAGSLIYPGVTIGGGAMITGRSVVKKDVPPFAIMAGNPAKALGDTRMIDKPVLVEHPELMEEYERWSGSYRSAD